MASIWYMDPINGLDANSGASLALAKRTLTGLEGVISAGDLCLISAGVIALGASGHTFAIAAWNGTWLVPYGNGDVVFDCENQVISNPAHLYSGASRTFAIYGCKIRNPYVGKYCIQGPAGAHVVNCVLYQRDGAANTGYGIRSCKTENCTLYNLNRGFFSPSAVYNTYLKSVTTPNLGGAHDYNAFSGNTETFGIDTDDANRDPGFEDASAEDFRLDQTTDVTAFEYFMANGWQGGSVGAYGVPGKFYDPRFLPFRFMTPDPSAGWLTTQNWINDSAYTDPGGQTGAIIEDATNKELVIDLATYPSANSARVLSPVWDFGSATHSLISFILQKFEDLPAGAALDLDTTLPTKFEYRTSATPFTQTAGSPSWTAMESGDALNDGNRYKQIRVTFRTNHSGS